MAYMEDSQAVIVFSNEMVEHFGEYTGHFNLVEESHALVLVSRGKGTKKDWRFRGGDCSTTR